MNLVYAGWLTASAFISAVVAFIAWRRRSAKGAVGLALYMLIMVVWAGAYAVRWIVSSLEAQYFWLNMTYLALYFARYVNGVAMRHGEISRGMFPNYPINSITNGVHVATWAGPPFQRMYDRHFPEWRRDNRYLRYAVSIPLAEIRQAHGEARDAAADGLGLLAGEIVRLFNQEQERRYPPAFP